MDQKQLIDTVEKILAQAKAQGATAAEAGASVENGLSVNVRLGEVETVEHHYERGFSVTVYLGERQGSASTSDMRDKSIEETVKAACSIARYTSADPYSGLPDKDRLAWQYPDLQLYHDWPLQAEKAIAIAKECEDAARSYDERITNSEGAQLSSHHGVTIRGNSHGFIGHYASSSHSVGCSVIAQDGDSMQRDYWYTVARDPSALEEVEQVGRCAAQRAVHRLNGRKISTQVVPVIFDAEVAAGLFGHFLGAIRGGSLYRKTSFLLDSLDQQLFPEWLTMTEFPHMQKALGSAPFDREGVKTEDRDIVVGGVLKTYLLDTYSAKRLGMQSTGHAGGVHNLVVKTGQQDLAGLLKTMGTGLLVNDLMGQGVNRVTGDYSRGAAGFWVENGEIQYPVEEITIAGNLKDMYKNILDIGCDVDLRRNIRTGSVLIGGMTVAGN